MTHPNIYDADPFRPLNWREERVIELVEAPGGPKRASRTFDDEYVRRYRAFLIRWRGYRNSEERRRLFPNYPALYHTQRFHERFSGEEQAVLEARLLSGASNADIAYECATSPDVVRWYEKLFYNVRDRLDRLDYIRNIVIIPMLRRAASYDDREILTDDKRQAIYRMMAYVGGPKVLDFILMGFKREAAPSRMAQLVDWMDKSYNNLIRHQGLMTIQAFSFNKYTVMQLLEMCRGVVQSADEAKRAGGAVTEFHSNVQAFLEQVHVNVGREAERGVHRDVLEWEKGKVEPKAEDYYGLAEGESPEDLKVFEGFQRPEPTPKEV